MYFLGQGGPPNNVLAYKWFSLSSAEGHMSARVGLEILAGAMTPTEIAQARKLARDWTEEFKKKPPSPLVFVR
jgi:TPR repeat protein